MDHFARVLSTVIKYDVKGEMERHLIVMKNRKWYLYCLRQLHLLGIQPVKKIQAIHAVCCHIPKGAELAGLHQHSMVKRIEKDIKVKLHRELQLQSSKQTIPWGIQRVRAPQTWDVTKGKGIQVAVLDTGISKHRDLQIKGEFNTISRKSVADLNGHGTHVAGTIAALQNTYGVVGVAPLVKLYAVKSFDKNGSANISDIIEGVTWCIKNGMRVINMSFGMSERIETLHEVIKLAYRKGIVMVASAGNNGSQNSQIEYPALFPETIAVAAATENNRIADFSSRGDGIDLAAPGVRILSTYTRNRYEELDGTSMAAPHVTGAASLLLSIRPTLTPLEIKTLLQQTATPIVGYSERAQGSGIINIERAMATLRTRP